MGDGAPPRPPPLESEDEDEQNFPMPQANQPIMVIKSLIITVSDMRQCLV